MISKKNILVFVFDGFADWETAYAMVGINKSECYRVRSIGIDKTIKKSMGGLSVLPDLDFFPDVDLSDIDPTNTALLILPGGEAWEERGNEAISLLVKHCVTEGIPVAAICAATVFLADLNLLNDIAHTSNELAYLRGLSSSYAGSACYQDVPCVNDANMITASGSAPIEFARSIFEMLEIYEHREVYQWFKYVDKIMV